MYKYEKEILEAQLGRENEVLKELQREYEAALKQINEKIMILQADPLTQSRIYQLQYQHALKAQVEAILEKLHADEYSTIQQYLSDSYSDSFISTMYCFHKQDVPLILPIDKKAAVRAVLTDSKIKGSLYAALGINVKAMKKSILQEITRGIASGASYSDIIRNLRNATKAPYANAKTIVRTEGHRIQQASAEDARQLAKEKGADVVKQWDATMDSSTRPTHQRLDGQIKETHEPFRHGTKEAMYPGDFGDPAEDCNCRCVALTRARWALDEDELEELKARAEYFGLDKSDSFEEFKGKYLKTAEAMEEADGEFDIFKFLEENDDAFVIEEVPPIQYPDDLLFTKKEQNILDGLNAYYENPDLPMSKWPKNYKIPTDAERLAMNGKLTSDFVSIERQRLQMQVSNAEEMIRQRKAEGYKFDKTAAIARREMNRELSYEEGHLVIGKDGIRHWQNSRKHALEALEELEFAEKLQRRYAFTNAADTLKNQVKSSIIEIDELTPCLRRMSDGKLVKTTIIDIVPSSEEFKDWEFNWTKPFNNGFSVRGIKVGGDDRIQGMVALKPVPRDYAVLVDIVEAAPFNNPHNKLFTKKEFAGVGGHLFAEAVRESYKQGFGGFVYFKAKTNLIEHYERELGAVLINPGERIMAIDERAAKKLYERYYKDE